MTSRPPDDGPADGSAAGPSDWIGLLYDRHADSLYRYAVMILADSAAARDAVHQVFVAIAGKPAGHIRAEERYLRRAVRNECYSALRCRRREGDTDDSPLLEAVAIDEKLVERLAIEEAIRTLPAEQREVLHLKVFDGWTFQQIADQIGESINTVASRYRYAIEKLRQQLGATRT